MSTSFSTDASRQDDRKESHNAENRGFAQGRGILQAYVYVSKVRVPLRPNSLVFAKNFLGSEARLFANQ
jgi:hypothetical protein